MSKDFKQAYTTFWKWFQENEKHFYNVVKNKSKDDIEKDFFRILSTKLDEIKTGFFFLSGMVNDSTAELVLTADGNIINIAFVEDLVGQAPIIDGWKFTASKPPVEGMNVVMHNLTFGADNLFFYPNEDKNFPDAIDITVVHPDLTKENADELLQGTYIYLDNYLGELDFLNNLDYMNIVGKDETEKELIPIGKLKDYLNWRQKEFIEKYEGTRYNTDNDEYALFEAELENGNMLLASMNLQLLRWDSKASHPWMANIYFKYNGVNGIPSKHDMELLYVIEDEIVKELIDSEGYLNVGRQTANDEREIYFACKDFRKPSKIFYHIQEKYANQFEINYEIYKDKYWKSFNRFGQN